MGLAAQNGPPVPPRTCRPSSLSLTANNNHLNNNNHSQARRQGSSVKSSKTLDERSTLQALPQDDGEERCQCCPYGFHIDLDFVRFCESIATGSELKQKREERRARRLQCNSMEVLLGLAPTPSYSGVGGRRLTGVGAVSRAPPLPVIVDQPLEPLTLRNPGRELDQVVDDFEAALSLSSRNSQSSQVSPRHYRRYESDDGHMQQTFNSEALQAVRGQMAASLDKLRQLEQQVKMIPVLQVKVSVLQEEKRKLVQQLADLKGKWSAAVGGARRDAAVGTPARPALQDGVVQTERWIKNVSHKLIQTLFQPRADSSAQTEPLAVAPVNAVKPSRTSSVTQTDPWTAATVRAKTLNVHVQTAARLQRTVPVQTETVVVHRKHVQTEPEDRQRPVERCHMSAQTESGAPAAKKSVGSGEDSVAGVLCDRCVTRRTRDAACGTDAARWAGAGVSVATQCFSTCPECKERSRTNRSRETVDRESQTVAATPPSDGTTTSTTATTTPSDQPPPSDAPSDSPSDSEENDPHTSATDSGDEFDDSEPAAAQPALQGDAEEEEELVEEEEQVGQEEEEEGEEEEDEEEDEEEEEEEEEEQAPPQPVKPRVRVEPSTEMKAALKVLNDAVRRPQSRSNASNNTSKQLVNAIEIARREWVHVSSTKDADAHAVEDYMDYVEGLSMQLLERVANMADNNGNTALHYAVSHSQWDIVSLLLDSKVCYPQLRNKAGYSPPMLAALAQPCNSTELQVLQRLFSLADVNAKATQHGQTALMLAVSHGRVDVVRLLLQCGADVNVQDADGSTALMCAAEHGHVPIVRLLLAQQDIDLDLRDNDGSTALSIAMEAGHKDIGLLVYAHMNFQRSSNSSSNASSPTVHSSPSTSSLTSNSASKNKSPAL